MSSASLPPSPASVRHVLTINSGSSSLKFALFELSNPPRRLASGMIERIGSSAAPFWVSALDAGVKTEEPVEALDHRQAIGHLIDWLSRNGYLTAELAVGHRVVHGGARFVDTFDINADVIRDLKTIVALAPNHLAGEIAAIEAIDVAMPTAKQFACFDTAFHRHLPQEARQLSIPRRYGLAGIRRYGFHGISYAYLMKELERIAGPEAARQRIILAHLGAGCSMAAVKDGIGIDTTMGFTPTAGLVMATRTGDLDPGVLIHLARTEGFNADQLEELVTKQAGLLGVSEVSSDIRDLLAMESSDPRAAEALALFCYQARKWIGALAAVLGGLETIVFSAGIGENSPAIRARISAGLEFLGVELEAERNAHNAAVISTDQSRVAVRVIPTDEESMIATEVARRLAPSREESSSPVVSSQSKQASFEGTTL